MGCHHVNAPGSNPGRHRALNYKFDRVWWDSYEALIQEKKERERDKINNLYITDFNKNGIFNKHVSKWLEKLGISNLP